MGEMLPKNDANKHSIGCRLNWCGLMSVVATISQIEGVYDIEEFLLIRDELCTGRFDTIYETVIDFIEYYNNNLK